jgi:hypothetical protein
MIHTIEFVKSGRGKAQCPPDPRYPMGVCADVTLGKEPSCVVTLPYPAPECGHFIVLCEVCKFSLAITATGRADDPIQVRVPCDTAAMEAANA